jgi:EAL domain-containing protein (putative c-di-GMP-specific phosphodiesterase class I)/ActR/RegA family two-component response regulator
MKKSLLIVDDEPHLLSALKSFFMREGYQVFTANNGEEALKIVSQSPVQVILSDYRMPGMTGAELLSQIKQNYPKTIRIILSGYADFESMQASINEGSVYKYILKPWDNEKLRQLIKDSFELYFDQSKDNLIEIDNMLISDHDLELALDQKQFELYYQPIINADTEAVVAAEALLRWHHPSQGILSPDAFLSLCEASGLIIPIGTWVLRKACQQLKEWHTLGYHNLKIAVNLSAIQFTRPGFVAVIQSTLTEIDLDPSFLELEITESLIMQNRKQVIEQLYALKALGITLSLDDFGMGYSSLSYIHEFPIHSLKIDKSFIQGITVNTEKLDLAVMIIQLAKKLNLITIAEGVETEEQLEKLKEAGCDLIQGYLFGKPLPANGFTKLLTEYR